MSTKWSKGIFCSHAGSCSLTWYLLFVCVCVDTQVRIFDGGLLEHCTLKKKSIRSRVTVDTLCVHWWTWWSLTPPGCCTAAKQSTLIAFTSLFLSTIQRSVCHWHWQTARMQLTGCTKRSTIWLIGQQKTFFSKNKMFRNSIWRTKWFINECWKESFVAAFLV